MSEHFDVCVIGAGPAGFAAAMRAHDLGKRVALVERGRVGGAGMHHGALSSKTFWHLSNDYARACRNDRGYATSCVDVHYKDVRAEVARAVHEREAIFSRQLAELAAPDPRGSFVELVRGTARFTGPKIVCVQTNTGERTLEADAFVLATGSSPRLPDGVPVDGVHVVTSDGIEDLETFPESLLVVGAGVIGCEYATIFANFGRTKVFVLDRQPRILPFEDEDVAACIAENFSRLGVTVHQGAKLLDLAIRDGGVDYSVGYADGRVVKNRVAKALVSTGRAPAVRGLGLEELGVAFDKSGGIAVEDGQSTTTPWLWAVGDTTADVALANVAELEGRHAIERIYGLASRPLRYEALSAIMFLQPEVASCGINEQTARERKIAHRVGVVQNRLVARNVAMRATEGFIKLVVSDEKPHQILGLRVVGPQASSAIAGVAFLVEKGGTLEDLDRLVHPHPAITEGVQECARLLLGHSVLKHAVFGEDLLTLRAWKPD